jgi:hypothetical protein
MKRESYATKVDDEARTYLVMTDMYYSAMYNTTEVGTWQDEDL